MSSDTSVDCRLICRPICQSRGAQNKHDPVFCQGMAVLLNPVCILLSEMFLVYKSEVRVAVFET